MQGGVRKIIQKEFIELVFEFVKKVSMLANVEQIILFGSVARGEADKRSDIDICIVINNENKKVISRLALDLEKKYNKNIQLVITKNFEKLDDYFIKQLFKEGIVLYGKSPYIKIKNMNCEKYSLIIFSLTNLSQMDKMKIKRILYGYETEKKVKGKTYTSSSKGLVKELNGKTAGRGAVLIPEKNVKYIADVFQERKIKYNVVELFKPIGS